MNKQQTLEEKVEHILNKYDFIANEAEIIKQIKSLFLQEVMRVKPENKLTTLFKKSNLEIHSVKIEGFNEALDEWEKNIQGALK